MLSEAWCDEILAKAGWEKGGQQFAYHFKKPTLNEIPVDSVPEAYDIVGHHPGDKNMCHNSFILYPINLSDMLAVPGNWDGEPWDKGYKADTGYF